LTSSVPGEGKSLLSLSLALLTAAGGRKAVILDCDQRLSQFVEQLGLSRDIGLSDVLGGQARILDAVQIDERFGLHVVPTLRGKEFYPDALATPRLSEAITDLRREYDLVILDSPPVVPVSDIGVIAHLCDEVYFICRWGRTKRSQVSDALLKLRMLHIDVAGIVFTQVDFKREAAFRGVPYIRYKQYWDG
jgi:Mrp family chromosome partitioning ATPase